MCYYILTETQGGDTVNPIEFKIAQIRAGVSKEDIAKFLGINPTTVYRKFNGESDFTLSELRTLKKVLNLSKDDVDRIFFSESLAETQEAEKGA
jgi:DNA-binding XRE family transcriptional regulator